MSDNSVFIVAACRTAVGNFQGQFSNFTAVELGSVVISEAINRAQLTPQDVDQVIMGHILTAGQGQNPARQAAIKAQVPQNVPAFTINMLCGSGLKSIFLGYQAIRNEDAEIIVAGGQESMTRAEHSAYVRGNKFGNLTLNDTLLLDGLTDAFNNVHMGKTAEHLAKKYNISRESQDNFALRSQTKAQVAIENGWFLKEIVPVIDKRTKKNINQDEFPKFNTTLEGLSKLRPAFDPDGTVTAGNSSGLNDGAAAVVLCSQKQLESRNLKPLAKILGFAEVAIDPMEMGLGPIGAIEKLMNKLGWTKQDVDLYELNEAFAVQSIIVVDQLGIDSGRVNICGGALALGHPIGASGARILVTLISSLKRIDKKRGIAALCIGGGMGIAIAIELC